MDGFQSFFASLMGSSSASNSVLSGTSLRVRISRGGSHVSASARRNCMARALGDVPFRALQMEIGRTLCRPHVVKALVRSLNTRSALSAHAAATCIALGVIGLGRIGNENGAVELIISQNAIEAMASVMRAHSNSSATVVAAANALGCIAIANRVVHDSGLLALPAPDESPGTVAIATRGPSRQILRELQAAATEECGNGSRWISPVGQATLGTLLRTLCVLADTAAGADLLRKQGAVQTLLGTLGASPSSVMVDSATNHLSAKSNSISVDPDSASDARSTSSGSQLGTEATALILGILSRLMDMSDLADGGFEIGVNVS